MCWGAYGELGVDLGEGVAGFAAGDLELGVVLNGEDAALGLAGCVGGREGEGRGEEGEEEGGFEIHGGGGWWGVINNSVLKWVMMK